jgi:hypothetical protein
MASNIRNPTVKAESSEQKAPKDTFETGIYPGTIIWSKKMMGFHNIVGVQQSPFLVKITGPPLNNNQMNELYRVARSYHIKRKQVVRAFKVEQKRSKQADAAREKEVLRRLHQKTFVPARVNAYIKARFQAHQDAQKNAQEAATEEVEGEDDDNTKGEKDDMDYIEERAGEVAGQTILPRRSKRVRH